MKFTVTFVTLLSITSSWAVLAKRVDDQKDKREASASYPSTSGHSSSVYPSSSSGHLSSSYQAPSTYQSSSSYQPQQSLSHGDASAISVGAGYSIGGAKPSYSFGGHGSGLEGLQSGGHSIQLAPITLQPNHGLAGTDLSQIMSQLQHSLNSGALTLQPSSTVAEFHEGGQAGQELSHGQFNYGSPNLQQYVLAGSVGSAPSYSAGTKGLSSYGSTGPVLFKPSSEGHGSPAALSFAAPNGGHSFGDASSVGGEHSYAGLSLGAPGHSAGLSLGAPGHSAGLSYGGSGLSYGGSGLSYGGSGLSLGHSLGASGHSLGGLSLGGAGGHSFGGAGLSLGGSGGHSFGGSGHSLGGSGLSLVSSGHGSGHSLGSAGNSLGGYYKVSSGGHGHGAPGKSAFKPSAFLGASIPSDSGLSGLSGSHGAPSYPSFSGFSGGGHGLSFGGFGALSGPSKSISPLYTKTESHGSDSAAAYSTGGHFSSPPGTTYGFPTASYPAGAIQAASSTGSQYYSSKYPSSSFGDGSFSYKSAGSLPRSLSSHSSGPKYSFGGHGSSSGRYASSPKDSHGAYSETSYNTIKYSEELKPRAH